MNNQKFLFQLSNWRENDSKPNSYESIQWKPHTNTIRINILVFNINLQIQYYCMILSLNYKNY